MTQSFEGWWLVTGEEVAALHAHAMRVYGGRDGTAREGCVDSSIESAKSAALYLADGGPVDLLACASRLLFYLAKNHCFVDGNKRVAWMTLVRVLAENGLSIEATEDDAVRLVEDVVKDVVDAHGVARWLAHPGRLVATGGGVGGR